MNKIKYLVLLCVLFICGCLCPHLGDLSGARLATSHDLSLAIVHNVQSNALDVTLRNVAGYPVAENYYSRNCTVWIVREGVPPLQLLDVSSLISLYPNPLPVLKPDEAHSFSISGDNIGLLPMEKLNVRDNTVFVEYGMGNGNLYSSALHITNDFIVGMEWTNVATNAPTAGK